MAFPILTLFTRLLHDTNRLVSRESVITITGKNVQPAFHDVLAAVKRDQRRCVRATLSLANVFIAAAEDLSISGRRHRSLRRSRSIPSPTQVYLRVRTSYPFPWLGVTSTVFSGTFPPIVNQVWVLSGEYSQFSSKLARTTVAEEANAGLSLTWQV